MTEPALFQQQREIWQAFRQAVAQRKLTERNAAQRWQTEQHAANRILEQILNQAKKALRPGRIQSYERVSKVAPGCQ
jgi:hypothetical protein